MDGITFIKKSKELYPELNYVVMTFHEDFHLIQEALRLGVIDYISKLKLDEENYEELFSRIRNAFHTSASKPADIHELSELLNHPAWLCDDLTLWKIEEIVTKDKTVVKELPTLLQIAIVHLESKLKITGITLPAFDSEEDAAILLYQLRENVTTLVQCHDNKTAQEQILLLANQIRDHYQEQIQMGDLSVANGLSRSYASTMFNKVLGITMNEFLRRKRIYESICRMKETSLSLTQIAEEIGYDSYHTFKKAFTEVMHLSPYEYRNQVSGQ